MGSERKPTLQEYVARAVARGCKNVYTLIPAKVVKWTPGEQRLDCQPLVMNTYRDESDDRQVESWPVVPGVRLQVVRAGPFRLTLPISDGRTVVDGEVAPATLGSLMFSHVSLDKWMSGDGREVDPEYDHDHALTDAVFIPGLYPDGDLLDDYTEDHMTLGHDDGVQLHSHQDVMTVATRADEAAAQAVALANLVRDQLDEIEDALINHTHQYVPGTAGTAQTGTSTSGYTAGDVAAEQLKAK
jgi:hypothetical protein